MDFSPAAIPPPLPEELHRASWSKTQVWVYAATALISAALMAYALTIGFVWDEGFHVIAAQLINRGKTPYIDFCFPQTPLNAYWNAAWMHVFGENWRVLHVAATLEITGALFLVAQFVLSRFPVARWRGPAALAAVCFVGLHSEVVQFGPIAQAYAAGMLLTFAAFRVAVARPDRTPGLLLAFGSGLLAGGAAGCTLLTAPVVLILLIWFWLRTAGMARVNAIALFALGALIPFTPVFWLFAKAPRQVFFNVVQYQALFRRVNWPGATTHDVDVLSSWLDDGQTLLLALLVLFGVYFLVKKSHWPFLSRRQFYLAAWIAGALVLYIAIAHPTFSRYFIVAVPLLSILTGIGLYGVGARLSDAGRPFWPTALLVSLLVLGYGRELFDERDSTTWMDYEKIAKKVDEVTPKNGRLYADELVYFLTKRTPPFGMEFSYSHKLDLSPAEEKLYHIISGKNSMRK
ncbi:MAG TPA: hypothetical protein VFA65_06730 [Bryobacteraceae bacterium]|nr:hypothetical protein [Bryobacteraceae bacterium]